MINRVEIRHYCHFKKNEDMHFVYARITRRIKKCFYTCTEITHIWNMMTCVKMETKLTSD